MPEAAIPNAPSNSSPVTGSSEGQSPPPSSTSTQSPASGGQRGAASPTAGQGGGSSPGKETPAVSADPASGKQSGGDDGAEAAAAKDARDRQAKRQADQVFQEIMIQHRDAIEALVAESAGSDALKAGLRKLLGKKFTPQFVLDLADEFKAPPADEDIDAKVDRKVEEKLSAKEQLEADRKAREAAAKAVEVQATLDKAIDKVIDEIDEHLKTHMEEYEGVELYPLTAEEVESRINAQFDKDGTVPDPIEIIKAYNEEKMTHVRKTRLGSKLAGSKIVDEDELDSTPARLHREAPDVDTSDMDEDSAIAAELAAFDRKQAEVLRRARG